MLKVPYNNFQCFTRLCSCDNNQADVRQWNCHLSGKCAITEKKYSVLLSRYNLKL